MGISILQEPGLSQEDKFSEANMQKRKASAVEEGDRHQRGVARPKAKAASWVTASKLHGAGKKGDSRQKVPSGPLGEIHGEGHGRTPLGSRTLSPQAMAEDIGGVAALPVSGKFMPEPRDACRD